MKRLILAGVVVQLCGVQAFLHAAPALAQSTPATTPSTPPVSTPPAPGEHPPTGGPNSPPLNEPANAIEKSGASPSGKTAATNGTVVSDGKVVATGDKATGSKAAGDKGRIDNASVVPGANSFTEAQARDRLLHGGFSQVSGLTKDSNGIWRGSAVKNGASVPVALDYKGHISSN